MIALRRSYIAPIVLAAAVVAVFGACVTASFHFDDYALFSDAAVTSASGWWEVWRPVQTRPLTYFTFWVNYALGGTNPAGYHALNLAFHVASVLLLFGLLSRLTPGAPAFIAAALFAVHPVVAEPVMYVFARGTLLATLLCLVSLQFWVKGRRWAAVGWFCAALAAKEECVAFPLFLLLMHFAVSRERKELKPIAAMLGLSLAAGLRVAIIASMIPGSGAGAGSTVSPLQYLATQGTVILRYFRLMVIPYGFTVDPEIPLAPGWKAILAWAVILAVAGVACRRLGRAKAAFWFLAGLILLLPSSSVFPADDLAADRRMYLPLTAFSAAAGLLLQRFKPRALVVAVVLLAALTVGRVQVWHSEETLWEEAVRRSPRKLRPKIRLARVVDDERALALLREAKSIAPDNPAVASEMGSRYMAMGTPGDALSEFGRALALAPGDPPALNNRGVALMALGQREVARRDFERALELDPCLFDARFNLSQLGVTTEAPEGCRFSDEQRKVLAEGHPVS